MRYIFIGFLLCIAGCSTHENKPPIIKREDFAFTPVDMEEDTFIPLKRPQRRQEIPTAFKVKVSITLTDQSSLKTAIATLASEAGVNYRVTGLEDKKDRGIFFSATDKPFIEIIETLCELAQLRYDIKGDLITIEPDTPYLKTYTISFPIQVRESANAVSTAINIFATEKNEAKNLDNSSSSVLKASSKSDFWEEVEQVLGVILETSAPSTDSGDSNKISKVISLHKQAGLLTLLANKKQHKIIEDYLEALRLASTAQVLIEAKILEVSLNDTYRNGINWQSLRPHFIAGLPIGTSASSGTELSNITEGNSDVFTLGFKDSKNISAIAHFIERFGSVRTLSNPRLTVMNNQTAVLKVAKNEVFFRVEYNRNFSNSVTGRDSEVAVSHMQTVPIGLVMTVQPAINLETGDVVLTLRPTISRIASTKEDPAVSYLSRAGSPNIGQAAMIKSTIPVVEVREMDSVLTLHSGEIALLGGLMQERDKGTRSGIPETQEIPVVNSLFNAHEKESELTELIILLRVRIMSPNAGISSMDRHILTKFGSNRRRLSTRK
ncbi:MAG: hypothetical protein LBH38_02870 [Holosporales bacterium]|jgi:general secretion pathway protein D|nr:hypothetical protein [Holosporales bacterium]